MQINTDNINTVYNHFSYYAATLKEFLFAREYRSPPPWPDVT